MRVFVALDIPEAVRSAVASCTARLRPTAPQARWARIEGVHITLKFIGEIPDEKVQQVQSALRPVSCPAPIAIAIRGVGFFPNEKSPRVFWAGVEAGPELGALAAAVETALEPLGIARENRPFSPHLTLARLETSGPLDALHRAIASCAPAEVGSFVVREFYLYRSVLKRGGSEYTRLVSYPFAGSAQ